VTTVLGQPERTVVLLSDRQSASSIVETYKAEELGVIESEGCLTIIADSLTSSNCCKSDHRDLSECVRHDGERCGSAGHRKALS